MHGGSACVIGREWFVNIGMRFRIWRSREENDFASRDDFSMWFA
jgi:hypothetical protein